MNAKSIGNTIARLRKKCGMTQVALAEKLNISDKTVSKWESGQGYPDVTLFPLLSSVFGVTIDYLMIGERRGIAVVGNTIADVVKSIDNYPGIGRLSHISDVTYAVGGCVPNVGINLVKIDRSIPVAAMGAVGMDEYGRYIIGQLQYHGINIDNMTFLSGVETAFTDVMSIPSGERTFFNKKGADAEFSPAHIDIKSLSCTLLHIGYIFMLDKFDAPDEEYGTVLARFLADVQAAGIKTSFDVQSSSTGDFAEKVIPALKYANYAIMNEIEATCTWNLEARLPSGKLNIDNIRLAMERMIECGVKDKAIVHSKEACFSLDAETGEFTAVPSLNLPKSEIRGSVGAGDAFCAGCLYGIYNEYSDKQLLEFASAAAACSLFAAGAVDSMRSKAEILALDQKYGRLKM